MIRLNYKIIPFVHVFFFIIFISVGYVANAFYFHEIPQDFCFFYQLTGGLGLFVIYCLCMSSYENRNNKHSRDYGIAANPISFLGIINHYALSVSSTLLICVATIIPNWNELEYISPDTAVFIKTISNWQLLFLFFMLYCIIAYWINYKVENGYIVMHEGKMLFPDDKYVMWPFFVYDSSVLYNQFVMGGKDLNISCRDGEKVCDILFMIELDDKKINRGNISESDFSIFCQKTVSIVVVAVKEQAKHIKKNDLFEQKMTPIEQKIGELYFKWDGDLIKADSFNFIQ